MKTKNTFFKTLAIALLAFFSVSLSKAQCPSVTNNLSCPVQVRVYLYVNCNPGVLCTAPFVVTIPPGGPMTINCPTACQNTTFCEITLELIQAGGSPVSPIFAKTLTACPSGGSTTTLPTACGGGTATMCYNGTDFEIN